MLGILKSQQIYLSIEYIATSKMNLFNLFSDIVYLSFICICSNMADPVFAFQLPDIDFLLKNRKIW